MIAAVLDVSDEEYTRIFAYADANHMTMDQVVKHATMTLVGAAERTAERTKRCVVCRQSHLHHHLPGPDWLRAIPGEGP